MPGFRSAEFDRNEVVVWVSPEREMEPWGRVFSSLALHRERERESHNASVTWPGERDERGRTGLQSSESSSAETMTERERRERESCRVRTKTRRADLSIRFGKGGN